MSMTWKGVMPAITTAFNADYSVDHGFVAEHAKWMIDSGGTGIVPLGSLGEGATLSFEEKIQILETILKSVGARVPVVPGISSLSTAEGVKLAKAAQKAGCKGLMVLPPYVYASDWREMKAHVEAIIKATSLPCMLYNNPVSYKTDFAPEQIAELAAAHRNLEAVKESSTDARRVTGIRALIGNRLAIFVGVDDVIVESIYMGAVGWIAGLVNAFPKESVALFNLAHRNDCEKTQKLYQWFLPLLRLDTTVKFVQMIKLAQELVGMGNARVRGPRLKLSGAELKATQAVIEKAIATRPKV